MLKLFVFCMLLGGCSTDAPKPAPSLVGGTWTMASRTEVLTPSVGHQGYTYPWPDAAGSTTLVFSASGKVAYTYRGAPTVLGTYTYLDHTLTMTVVGSGPAGTGTVRTIAELTDHRLVTQWQYDNANGRYDFSDTFTR